VGKGLRTGAHVRPEVARQGGTDVSGIIIYRSSYGSTKQYADWLSEATGFPVYDQKTAAIPWDEAELIVLGCPIVANKPFLSAWIQKQWDRMRDKRVFLFTTSGADPATAPVDQWIAAGLPADLLSQIQCFPLPGRFEFDKLNGVHKLMLRIGAVVLRSDEIKHQMSHPVDGVSRDRLAPLIAAIQTEATTA